MSLLQKAVNLGWYVYHAGRATFSTANVPQRRAGSYEGAATGRRLGNWTPGDDGVNTLLFKDATLMRSRSRDLVRRNAWASNAVDSLVAAMIIVAAIH